MPSGNSRRSRRACTGKSAHRSSGRVVRSWPAAFVRRISYKAFLYWFQIACRSASAGTIAASNPHVPRETYPETQRHNQFSIPESLCHTAATIGIGCSACIVTGTNKRKSFLGLGAAGTWIDRCLTRTSAITAQTRPGIMLTCQRRHWRWRS